MARWPRPEVSRCLGRARRRAQIDPTGKGIVVGKRPVTVASDHDVVDQWNPKQLPAFHESLCEGVVFVGWRRVSAGVVVGKVGTATVSPSEILTLN